MPHPSPKLRLNSPMPQTPSSIPGSPLASASPTSDTASPSRRGPVESTFQRNFRANIKTFAILRKNWEILHSNGNEAIKRIEKSEAAIRDLENLHGSARSVERLIKQEGVLEDEKIGLWLIFEKFTRQYEILKTLRSQLRNLVQEAVRRKGFEHAFLDPLFTTWPLSQLVDLFDGVVHQYSLAYQAVMISIRDLGEGELKAAQGREDWKATSLVDNWTLRRLDDILEVEMPEPSL